MASPFRMPAFSAALSAVTSSTMTPAVTPLVAGPSTSSRSDRHPDTAATGEDFQRARRLRSHDAGLAVRRGRQDGTDSRGRCECRAERGCFPDGHRLFLLMAARGLPGRAGERLPHAARANKRLQNPAASNARGRLPHSKGCARLSSWLARRTAELSPPLSSARSPCLAAPLPSGPEVSLLTDHKGRTAAAGHDFAAKTAGMRFDVYRCGRAESNGAR